MNVKKQCIILTQSRDIKWDELKKEINFNTREQYWHKFIIKNIEKLDNHTIMNAFLDNIYPDEFWPIMFKRDMFGSVEFLGKANESIIETLVTKKLAISITQDNVTKLLPVDVLYQYCPGEVIKVDFHEMFFKVIEKRFNRRKNELNLQSFHKEQDIKEYCPLSQPKLLYFILHLTASFQPKCIKLGNNFIRSLASVEFSDLKYIEEIDLRYNRIENVQELESLKSLGLKSIILDGNPLCEHFKTSEEYVTIFKNMFPTLLLLDTFNLIGPPRWPVKHYLCKADGYYFTHNFLKSFFFTFDSDFRHLLGGTYHKNALFSMCVTVNSASDKFADFSQHSRNFVSLLSRVKHMEKIFVGQAKIIELFIDLPLTKHDLCSLETDLLMFTDVLVSLVVTGIFRCTTNQTHQYYTFSRHFIMQGKNYSDYVITNEIWYISSIYPSTEDNLFQNANGDIKTIVAKNNEESLILKDAFEKITEVPSNCSIRYLESHRLDKAIHSFMNEYKNKSPPQTEVNRRIVAENLNYPSPMADSSGRGLLTQIQQGGSNTQIAEGNPSGFLQNFTSSMFNAPFNKKNIKKINERTNLKQITLN